MDRMNPYKNRKKQPVLGILLLVGLLLAGSLQPVKAGVEEMPENSAETDTETSQPEQPVKQAAEAPQLSIGRESLQTVKAGEKFEVRLFVDNSRQDYELKRVQLTLSTSEDMALREPTNILTLGTIQAGAERNCTVRLKMEKQVPSSSQILYTTLNYEYESAGETVEGTYSAEILIPVASTEEAAENGTGKPEETPQGAEEDLFGSSGAEVPSSASDSETQEKKKTADPATPNVIVSHYEYGDQVEAGQNFTLHMLVKNTSTQTAVGNMILAVETGEALSIVNTSNTMYIDALNPQQTMELNIPLQALADGKPEGSKLDLSFKYEFVINDTRTQGTSAEKIAIPVAQPDRYIISDPVLEPEIRKDSETTISIPYVNKGKGTVYNVEARITTGDNLKVTESYQYLGNLDAGASGTADFIAVPAKVGEETVKIQITYEDSSNHQKEVVKKTKLQVEEAAAEFGEDEFSDMEAYGMAGEQPSTGGKKYAAIGAAAAALLGGIVYYRKKKKKKQEESEDIDDEEDWQ